ncbi:MAG: M48 family metalloprotease [Acidobacteriia bacterium]|nr:M48 family metalloprotease [Terriglobia bacterium]
MMTSTLESYTLGHTIVLSRGLIDVLPDEASLATMLAHELGHIVLGHRLNSTYAFFDQLLVDDKETFKHFGFARTPDEENQASKKAMELLNNSPYKNQLGNAGLFLQALDRRAKDIPNLASAHLGNRVPAIGDLKTAAPANGQKNPQQIAALPLGGRVKLDPWNNRLELLKAKPIGSVTEREKMPFEVTPFMPYLTRFGSDAAKPPAAASATAAAPPAATPAPADAAAAPKPGEEKPKDTPPANQP